MQLCCLHPNLQISEASQSKEGRAFDEGGLNNSRREKAAHSMKAASTICGARRPRIR
jgi:hypothetical protein